MIFTCSLWLGEWPSAWDMAAALELIAAGSCLISATQRRPAPTLNDLTKQWDEMSLEWRLDLPPLLHVTSLPRAPCLLGSRSVSQPRPQMRSAP